MDTDVDQEASAQAVELARQIFDEADIDQNGKIDQIELTEMMLKLWRHLGLRLSEDGLLREPMDHHEKINNGGRWVTVQGDIQKMMDCFDIDHDGWLDFAEVCGILGTEPWAKVFPKEARGGLDAALARVLREWQTTRADPVLIDRLHRTAAEIQKLEEEKLERDHLIQLDRAETMRRWEIEKMELQRVIEDRNRFAFDATLSRLPSTSRRRAEDEYRALLQEQAERLGMGVPERLGMALPQEQESSMEMRRLARPTVSMAAESEFAHIRAAEVAEEAALAQRCAWLEAECAHLEAAGAAQ